MNTLIRIKAMSKCAANPDQQFAVCKQGLSVSTGV